MAVSQSQSERQQAGRQQKECKEEPSARLALELPAGRGEAIGGREQSNPARKDSSHVARPTRLFPNE